MYADGIAGEFHSVYGKVVTALELGVYAQALEGFQDRRCKIAEHPGGVQVLVLLQILDESEVEIAKIVENSASAAEPPDYRNVVAFGVF